MQCYNLVLVSYSQIIDACAQFHCLSVLTNEVKKGAHLSPFDHHRRYYHQGLGRRTGRLSGPLPTNIPVGYGDATATATVTATVTALHQ